MPFSPCDPQRSLNISAPVYHVSPKASKTPQTRCCLQRTLYTNPELNGKTNTTVWQTGHDSRRVVSAKANAEVVRLDPMEIPCVQTLGMDKCYNYSLGEMKVIIPS